MYAPIPTTFKDQFLTLVASGATENQALLKLNILYSEYLTLLLSDAPFSKAVEDARKARADVWVGRIIDSTYAEFEKEDVPKERLRFDMLTFLAKADNPDRYGGKPTAKEVNFTLNLSEYKTLTLDQANKVLAEDPFAPVEAEFTEIKEDNEDNPL